MSQQTILVTGAAGFIGARFAESCLKKGLSVVAVDEIAHFSNRPEHQHIPFKTIIDREGLFEWLKTTSLRVGAPSLKAIVHLGACTDTTELNCDYLNKLNLNYSKEIWSYATTHRIPLVYASSAATYGDGSLGYDDDE